MNPQDLTALLPVVLEAAQKAALRAMGDFGKPKKVTFKADGSPVSQTDVEAEAIITAILRARCGYAIVAEEEFEAGKTGMINPDAPFFLIDALDGTHEFIKDGPDFTVNVALVVNRLPVLGVIIAPALGLTWHAIHGAGAYRCDNTGTAQVCVRIAGPDGLALLGGKKSSMPEVLEPFVGAQTVASREQRASSLKFCLLAEGQADLYPRLGETCEWDTAAGDIILREAGGTVLDIETGLPIVYGKQEARFINRGFIAGSRNTFLPRP